VTSRTNTAKVAMAALLPLALVGGCARYRPPALPVGSGDVEARCAALATRAAASTSSVGESDPEFERLKPTADRLAGHIDKETGAVKDTFGDRLYMGVVAPWVFMASVPDVVSAIKAKRERVYADGYSACVRLGGQWQPGQPEVAPQCPGTSVWNGVGCTAVKP
jgi:hypothetical protein